MEESTVVDAGSGRSVPTWAGLQLSEDSRGGQSAQHTVQAVSLTTRASQGLPAAALPQSA